MASFEYSGSLSTQKAYGARQTTLRRCVFTSPSPGPPEPEFLGFGNSRCVQLSALRLDQGGVVLLIEREVVDSLPGTLRVLHLIRG